MTGSGAMAQTASPDFEETLIGPVQPPSADAEQEAELTAARSQLQDLNRDISHAQARLVQGQNDLVTLQDRAQQLRDDIAQAQQDMAQQTAAATAETARLAEEARMARSQIEAMTQTIDGLHAREVAQIERLLQLETDHEALQAQHDALQAEMAELSDRRDTLQTETARAEALAEQIRLQEEQSQTLTDRIGVLTAELSALTRIFEQSIAQESPAEAASPVADDIASDILAQDAPDPEAAVVVQRSPAAVDAALAAAPGLPAEPGPRRRLRSLLIEGHCAPDALRAVQNPINRQTLLVLMDRLDRC